MRSLPSPRLLLHIAWVALPLTVGWGVGPALGQLSIPVSVVAQALLWIGWAAGVIAVRLPRSVSLTVLRVLAPAGTAVAAWAAGRDGATAATLLALAWSTATAAAVLLAPVVADQMVDGSSYGDETRFVLRTPPVLLLGPLELIWALTVAGVAAGPLLLAARQWVPGALLVAVGPAVAWMGVRVLHRLSRRWLVFVPAGVVIHDPLVLAEPVLFPRRLIARFAPALADTAATALDLTGGGAGLVLELHLTEPVTVALTGRRLVEERTRTSDRFLLTAARPGAVGREALRRRLARATTASG